MLPRYRVKYLCQKTSDKCRLLQPEAALCCWCVSVRILVAAYDNLLLSVYCQSINWDLR